MAAGALLTDWYQLTMLKAYWEHGMHETAVFEFFVRRLPSNRNFLLAAGLAPGWSASGQRVIGSKRPGSKRA